MLHVKLYNIQFLAEIGKGTTVLGYLLWGPMVKREHRLPNKSGIYIYANSTTQPRGWPQEYFFVIVSQNIHNPGKDFIIPVTLFYLMINNEKIFIPRDKLVKG